MGVEESIKRIRQKFDFLFVRDNFRLTYCSRTLLRPAYALLGLQSSQCKLVFELEESEYALLIGPKTAVFGNNETSDPVQQWFSLDWVNEFVGEQYIIQPHPKDPDGIDEFLQVHAHFLKQYGSMLFVMFQSPTTLAQWYPDYQRFIQRKLGIDRSEV